MEKFQLCAVRTHMGANGWSVRDWICCRTPRRFLIRWLNCSFFPISCTSDQLSRLHMILKPFMLRRIKKDVENELSDKVRKSIYSNEYFNFIVIALFSNLDFANSFVSLHIWNLIVDLSWTFSFWHDVPEISLGVNVTEEPLINKLSSRENILWTVNKWKIFKPD